MNIAGDGGRSHTGMNRACVGDEKVQSVIADSDRCSAEDFF